ncbi:hypothetical protein DFR58_103231 [Anaerobacterium chartisolvens]|uniref:Uncharacterized protein n=1 Tax=Anaerobacterium chartisolvens TaxID=1297424 RepID=A0A369BIF7_9FIRM|nr:hypothetical protein [Anaerobacterium chartisolvens]RCX19484.1 hypothetical protein DFR58_103231 [Anaerobacterium chartisolvens]
MDQYNQIIGFWQAYKITSVADLDKYLMIRNHPPLIVYEEDKRMYFECLQKYDEAEELSPLYQFFKYETEKTWERALAFADGMKLERKGLSDFIQG